MFRALLASGYFWQVVTTEDMINAIFFLLVFIIFMDFHSRILCLFPQPCYLPDRGMTAVSYELDDGQRKV